MPPSPVSKETFTHPEELNASQIQTIGKAYLKRHPKTDVNSCVRFFDSFAHTNHPTAHRLKQCRTDLDTYENWHFLADCYGDLVKSKGELSNAIMQLFKAAFKNIPFAYELIHCTDTINDCQLNEEFTPQQVRETLKIVIDNYYLTKYQSQLKQLTTSTPTDNVLLTPDDLSNNMIQHIGREYLQNQSANKGCFNFLENSSQLNQPTALQLKNYNNTSSAYEKWLFLAKAYSDLTESNGELSNKILQTFLNAFGKSPYTHRVRCNFSRFTLHSYNEYYQPAQISLALTAIVNQYYLHQCREMLQLQERKLNRIAI